MNSSHFRIENHHEFKSLPFCFGHEDKSWLMDERSTLVKKLRKKRYKKLSVIFEYEKICLQILCNDFINVE